MSRINRRHFLAAFTATMGGALLVACGAPAASPTSAPAQAEPTKPAAAATQPAAAATKPAAEPTKPAAAANPTAAPAAKTGGLPANTFVFGRGGDSVKLDPAVVTDGESSRVTEQMYETLAFFDGATTNVKPGLAESWKTSADGKTWTFKIRQGVKFHDGTPLDAEAVVFNFQRWMDEKHPFHKGGDFSYWGDMFGGYKNNAENEKDLIVDGVKATDASTVEFTLKVPSAPFIQNLAMFCFAIASPTAIKKDVDNYFKNPVGTGPFKFVEWVPDDHITLAANKDYWGEKAKVDQVIVRVIKDNTARYLELKAGTILGMEGANPDDAKAAKNEADLKVILRPSMNVAYIGYNFKDPNLNKKETRLAIAYAVNRQAIVDALYGGIGTVASQFVPPSVWGNNPDIKPYPYDVQKAKDMLKQAGVEKGFAIDLWYMPVSRPYFPDPKSVAEAFAADLAKVGITANLKTEDWGQYLKDRNGKLPFWMLGWTGDNGDPDNFLYVFFGRLNSDTSPNENTWDNKAVRDMLAKAQASTDKAEREQIYKDVAKIVYDECPRLPIAHTTPPLLFRKNVNGYVANPTGTEFYSTVTVS